MQTNTELTVTPLETVQAMYECFGRGDIPALLELLDDHVDWSSGIDPSVPDHDTVPIRRHGIGKDAASAYFTAVGSDFEFHSFAPQTMAMSGDEVFVRLSVDLTVRPTGKRIAFDEIHDFVVQNGRVVRFRGFVDTAMFIEAYRH